MPRYFFHTTNGVHDRDKEGTELPNLDAARREAIRFAGTVISQEPDMLLNKHDFRVEVTDQNDLALFTIAVLAANAA